MIPLISRQYPLRQHHTMKHQNVSTCNFVHIYYYLLLLLLLLLFILIAIGEVSTGGSVMKSAPVASKHDIFVGKNLALSLTIHVHLPPSLLSLSLSYFDPFSCLRAIVSHTSVFKARPIVQII